MARIKREQQIEEAIERLKIIDSDEHLILDAFKRGEVMKSEYQNRMFDAVLYNIDDEVQDYINKFEKEHQALVYHVQMTPTLCGNIYSLFYVSRHIEEWDADKADLKDGYGFVWAWNKDIPMWSEFGLITFKSSMGGIARLG